MTNSDDSYFLSGDFVINNWSKEANLVKLPPLIHSNFSYSFDFKKDKNDDIFSLELSISEYQGSKHEIQIKIAIVNYKDSTKIIEKSIIDSFTLTNRIIFMEIPIKISAITEENGWIKDDALTIKYEISHGKNTNYRGINETKETWKIMNFDLEEPFRSPSFHFNDLVYYIERRIDYRTIDFFLIAESISQPISINAQLSILSPNNPNEKLLTKERKVDFKNLGDIARFVMGFEVSKLNTLLDPHNNALTIELSMTKLNTALSSGQNGSIQSSIPIPPPPPPGPNGIPLPPPPPPPGTKPKPQEPVEILPYAGLKNQGATCYLNSLLQSLYHIPAFRKLVFSLPTSEKDNLMTSIPLELQLLFARMQLDNKPCSTQGLTISFGWTEYQSFIQQDIQELSRVLIYNLSLKLVGTNLEGDIDKLFRGESRSYIDCINVPYHSQRQEYFYDLQLQIRGCPTLEDSFKLYCSKELLTGPNQYTTDVYGKQDAYMGQDFISLPPVLQLHLARFEYDYDTDMMVKVNDKQTFPEEIDLNPYTKEQTGDNIYELFGVLVHAGSINGGHYYAYLRPTKEKEWFSFNDSIVKRATKKEAIDDNFGKENPMKFDKGFSAYMLVYIKKSMIDALFVDINPKECVPNHVLKYIEDNPDDEKVFRRMMCDSRPIIFNVTSEEGLRENAEESKISFSHQNHTKDITLMSDKTVNDLYNRVSEDFNFEGKEFKLWQCFSSGSPSIPLERSDSVLLDDIKQTSIFVQLSSLEIDIAKTKDMILTYAFFYFSKSSDQEESLHHNADEQVLFYLKALPCKSNETISDVFQNINETVGLPKDTNLLVYEATEPQAMRQLINNESFQNNGIANGNILIFNIDPENPSYLSLVPSKLTHSVSNKELKEEEKAKEERNTINWCNLKGENEMRTILQFYINKIAQVTIQVFDYDTLEKVGVVKIPRTCTLADLKEIVAVCAKVEIGENDSIQLFKRDPKVDIPSSSPISYSTNTVDQIFPANTKRDPLVYFLVFKGISETQLKLMNSYIVEYSKDSLKVTKRLRIPLQKPSTCELLFNYLKNTKIIEETVTENNVRFSLIKNGKFSKIYSSIKDALPDSLSTIRVDYSENPNSFMILDNDEKILQFVLCEPDPMNNAKPVFQCFLHKVKLSMKVKEVKIICKEAFSLKDDDTLNLMFGQELAKVQKSSFFNEEDTFENILKRDTRKDPPIYVIRKSTINVGTMGCAEADMSIIIYN